MEYDNPKFHAAIGIRTIADRNKKCCSKIIVAYNRKHDVL